MSNSQPSGTKRFLIPATVLVILSGLLLASLWPVARSYARTESRRLSDEAGKASGAEAEVDYHLAYRLDHGNATAALHFAVAQLASDQPAAAIVTLAEAGEGSDVLETRLDAYLELEEISSAIGAANALVESEASQSGLALAALAYGVGERGSALRALEPLLTAPEARQRLTRAEAGNLPLASELYAAGLLRSSSTILRKLPASAQRSLLLGRIGYRRHTQASLTEAVDYYQSVLAIDPANQPARGELIKTYTDLGRSNEAAAEQSLYDKLAAGRP